MALGGGNSGGSASGIKAGSAYVTLGLKNFLPQDLLKAQQSFGKFGDAIGKMGRAMALGGAAALSPLVGAMSTLNDVAKQGSIAKSLGLTSEQFTGIAGVAKSVGNDTKEFIESLVTLGKLGTDAAAGTEQASAAFASMGLNANEFIKLRADEQFFAVFEALAKIPDPLTRVRVLMQAFGEDGGKILLPLLGKTGAELREMAKGFGISTDDMKAATSAQQAYTAATSALGKAWQSVSIAAAPIVKILADGIAQAVAPFREFVNANREAVVGLSLAAGGVTVLGVGLMVLGPAIKALTASWALFTGAVAIGKAVIAGTMAVIAAPILLIPAGLAAAGAAWLAFTDKGNATVKGFADGIANAFGPTFDNLKSGWVEVVEAFQDGDFESAISIGMATIEVEWVRFTGSLTKQWRSAMQEMHEDFEEFGKDGAGKFIANLGQGAEAWWEDIGDFLAPPQVLKDINNGKLKGAGLLQLGGGGAAGLLQPAPAGLIMQGETPEQRKLREANERRTAAIEAKNLRQLDRLAGNWDFGGGADFGWREGPLGAQIAGIAAQSRGGFGGTVSSGMFGGGDVGQKLVNNTKETADGIKKLIGIGSSRHAEKMGELTVEGGT